MSNNKQSSVEWLCERLALKLGVPMAISFYIDHAEEIAKAKAMHKEEMKEAWDNAAIEATYGNKFRNFEQYYNETFKDE